MDERVLLVLCSFIAILAIGIIRKLCSRVKLRGACWLAAIFAEYFACVILAVLNIAGPNQLWHLCFPFAGVYVAFVGVFWSEVLCLVITLIFKVIKRNFNRFSGKVLWARLIISALISVAFLTYGIINIENVIPQYHVYESNKVSEELNFVFLSDVHGGSAQSFSTLQATVSKINSEKNLDFVVLGGDITDEYSTRDDMKKTYSILGEIKAPVYFVYGNHDRQFNAKYANGCQYSQEQLQQEIEKNGITILRDELVEITDDVVILGREDLDYEGRKLVEELPPEDNKKYNITFSHQGHDFEDAARIGADLQVSGHSHSGQFWPCKLFFRLFGFETIGEYRYGNTLFYVSPGEGGWLIPNRTEEHCEYEVFTIRPQE